MAEDETQDAQTVQPLPSPRGKDVLPSVRLDAFCCPYCGAYTHQYWYTLYISRLDKGELPFLPDDDFSARVEKVPDLDKETRERWKITSQKFKTGRVFFESAKTNYGETQANNLHLSKCYTCDKIAVWVHDRLVQPPQRSGPQPNEDLPGDAVQDYEEAQSILSLSPRGAAALLRLCVEKLCIHLKADGKSIDAMIGNLVKQGLDARIQKSLDAVRVIGNDAVHPGQMNLNDNPEIAETLFKLVNLIADKMISEPKHVDEVYGSLPQLKLDGIENRDKGSKKE